MSGNLAQHLDRCDVRTDEPRDIRRMGRDALPARTQDHIVATTPMMLVVSRHPAAMRKLVAVAA
jgi:hypothetical protein